MNIPCTVEPDIARHLVAVGKAERKEAQKSFHFFDYLNKLDMQDAMSRTGETGRLSAMALGALHQKNDVLARSYLSSMLDAAAEDYAETMTPKNDAAGLAA